MLSPDRVISAIMERRQKSDAPLLVFWCQVKSGREDFANAIRKHRDGHAILPVVIRGSGFANPNALLADINKLLRDLQDQVQQMISRITDGGAPTLLLLSRTTLDIPQLCSPIALPLWFPGVGGQIVDVFIEDLNSSTEGKLNAPELRITEVSEALFHLECALQKRLLEVHAFDHRKSNAFFESIRDEKLPKQTWQEFLDAAQTTIGRIGGGAGFRPSARDGLTVVARILRLSGKSSPDEMNSRAKGLATALMLDEGLLHNYRDSLVSVLLRPIIRDNSIGLQFARNIVVTTYISAQLLTAAAHADDYPPFPVLLLQAFSFDLRSAVQNMGHAIQSLKDPGALIS